MDPAEQDPASGRCQRRAPAPGALPAPGTPSGTEAWPADPGPVLLCNAMLPTGKATDVLLHDGRVAAVGPQASSHPAALGADAHDLAGYVLLPSAVEAHSHLDKALLAEQCPNAPGDLPGAIAAVRRSYPGMGVRDIRDRAAAVLTTAVRHGYTAMRTHATCEAGIGTRALQALCALRDEWSGLADLQVVAMIGMPLTGREGAPQRDLLDEAIRLGADLVGGAPALDSRPGHALRLLTGTAADAGLPIDLHLDETTDAGVLTLSDFIAEVERLGLPGRATASHCVSLGQQDPATAARLAARVAQAGIAVVTLPQTNLFLQGRAEHTRVPRGLTAVRALREAGVVVAAGGDNWRDPFNPLGRIDPFETAALLVAAAHLSVTEAYAAVSSQARLVMGLPPVSVTQDSAADLLAVRATGLGEAVAGADLDRWVFRRGRLVARTRTVHEVEPAQWLGQDPRH